MKEARISDSMKKLNNKRKIQIENADINSIYDLLTSLSGNEELHFFDYFHPQWSDPGAYVTVVKYNNKYLYKIGNHGWGSNWHFIDIHRLSRYILKNRNYQGDDIYIRDIINKLKLSDNGATSEMFWEDKLKLVLSKKEKFSLFEVNGYHLMYINNMNKAYVISEDEEEKLSFEEGFIEYLYDKYSTNSPQYKDRTVIIKWKA